MKIRFGIVGVGHRGITLARKLAAMDDVDLAGLADQDAQRLEAVAGELGVDNTYPLLSEMLEGLSLDAIMVLTPDLVHRGQVVEGLESGVHVLVEKPPAYSVPATEEMAQAAEKSGKHLMVAWNRTYALGRVKEIFADEPPAVVMANFVRPDPLYLGLLRDHIIDPFYLLCGEPDDIVAQGNMFDEEREGNVVASIRFANGSLGQLTTSFGAGGRSEQLTAYGDGYSVFVESTSGGAGRIVRGGDTIETLEPVDSITLEIRHFIDCIRQDREPLTSGRHAVRIMRFTWAVMEAAGLRMPPGAG